ncbi:TraC family protein [Patescibacteria group bacterium]|jgi:hypothetical protein|nr:TraC family protein [Patescibacteria group bacterium]
MWLWKVNKTGSAIDQIGIIGARDGMLLMTNNCYCCVIETSAVNFELKSEAEQDALIEIFQSFLNSLNSKVQFIVRVREIDLDRYMEELAHRLDLENNPVYQSQIESYSQFVRSLVSLNKILSRNFYVCIPLELKNKQDMDSIREQLSLKTEIVARGLQRLGMHARQLDSLELLNLFYSFFNPVQAKTQPLIPATLKQMHVALMKENA